jgi:hypothetical protein
MYCPLCKSEYREGVSKCATCAAALVASLDAPEVQANPPRLLWIGRDSGEFDLVAGALREGQVPADAQERLAGLVGSILRTQSRIHVLQSELDRALEVADAALAGRPKNPEALQHCYSCGAECWASLAVCPQCKAVLQVEPAKKDAAGAAASKAVVSGRKYCPVCDAPYLAAHDRCSLCGVELVPEELRGQPLNEKERREHIERVWRSSDPVSVSQAIATLRGAGINYDLKATHDHLAYGMGIPRAEYELRVFASDAEEAQKLLVGIRETAPFGTQDPPPVERMEQVTVPATKRAAASEWNPAQATVSTWEGEDAALARVLEDCLHENGIGVRREGREPGTVRLFVMPPDADSAREIIREVRDGVPPA